MIPPVAASEAGRAQLWKPGRLGVVEWRRGRGWAERASLLEGSAGEGESPVARKAEPMLAADESGCLGMQPKGGGRSHQRLNMGKRPIANKYREGKMKRTLERV